MVLVSSLGGGISRVTRFIIPKRRFSLANWWRMIYASAEPTKIKGPQGRIQEKEEDEGQGHTWMVRALDVGDAPASRSGSPLQSSSRGRQGGQGGSIKE